MTRLIFAVLLLFIPSLAVADPTTDMLAPTAVVQSTAGAGTAEAFKSDPYLGTYLVTNWHVVEGAANLTVQFYGQTKKWPATVVRYDKKHDLAVLLVSDVHKELVTFGDQNDVQMFQATICVGNPENQGIMPSQGIITGINQPFGKRLMTRTDCKIAPGNSGGGLYVQNKDKWVMVGIPSDVFGVSSFVTEIPISFMGMAVPIEQIKAFLKENAL